MKPHKHAELIKAWADGAEIESKPQFADDEEWRSDHCPRWYSLGVDYRIKPKPQPDFYMYACIDFDGMELLDSELSSSLHNVKLTFDGNAENSWKLKDVEVLK
jgi:hypothetical protein